MEDLKQFFNDIHRIAEGFEKIASSMATIGGVKIENNTAQIPTVQNATPNTPNPVETPQSPTAIPVSNTVQTYTRDQIAVAMGRALDAGKTGELRKLMSDFGVSSLGELPEDKYNDLVLKLKQIGVDV